MTGGRLAVFCDFDGTAARRDVGYNMFRHFSGGRNDALLPDWKAGRLSTRECLLREAEMVRVPAREVLEYLDRFELDPTFEPFVRLCRSCRVPVIVVSEGLDFYIRRVLAGVGLDDLPLLCNVGVLRDHSLQIVFPHVNRVCRRCGNCKGERITEYRREAGGAIKVAFVGDGYSDACAARQADLLFAKSDLELYCRAERIAYNSFDDFSDVTSQLRRQGFLTS